MMQGAAAIIIAEEALDEAEIQRFSELIAHQPPWSDFPLILLTLSGAVTADSQRRRLLRAPLVRALELERPIRPETLISTVQVAIRTRLRQYELRDQMVRQQMVQDALLQSEKLAVVGRLAATIAHEINNPLEAATNLVYLARTTPDDAKRREYLLMAESELARVAAIATETLKFYRQPNKATQVQIGPIFDSLFTLYHQKLRSAQIKVCTDFKTDRPILAFGGELRQVFSNLLTNAIDASRGATLTIRTKPAVSRAGISGLRVVFADSGSGVPDRLRDKIFEPFITTKGSSGTGLGLWVTAQIVQKHGGTIRVKSSTHPQRHGTVFSIFLPEAPPIAQPEEESVQATAVGATRDRKDDTRISA
jgi:signal transduction histidine kinase